MPGKKQPFTLKVDQTSRGFELITFMDRYNNVCSLQQSSLADFTQPGTSAIWLGCEHEEIHHVTGEPVGARMHLDLERVKALIPVLQRWVDTGSFREPQ